MESDPVREGFVASFARPGGNVTGSFVDQPALTGKCLELIREVVPRTSRVAVLWDPATGSAQLDAIQTSARSFAIEIHVFDYDVVFLDLAKAEPQALVLLSSPRMFGQRARLEELASKARLPTITMFKAFSEVGGLLSYGPDPVEIARRCASLADKILKGQKPGDIPIDVPTRFELVINVKTAAALGVSIPALLLSRADQVID